MSALIIAEHNNHKLRSATFAAISAANKLTKNIVVLVVGYNCQSVVTQSSITQFVSKVLYIDHINYNNLIAEDLTSIVLEHFSQNTKDPYKYIICAATLFGKNVLPRIAAKLNVEQGSEITKIIAPDLFERSICSGSFIQTIQLCCAIKCLTVRVIDFLEPLVNQNPALIQKLNFTELPINTQIKFITSNFSGSVNRPELTNAKIVVAGGSSLKTKENFALIEQLADQLNAAVGATKSAVDLGFASNDCQIGQTGKIIAPNLYIAIGISGAIQHIVGVRESKIIVAINNDEHANIFKIANYAIVGDLFKIVPELIAGISHSLGTSKK